MKTITIAIRTRNKGKLCNIKCPLYDSGHNSFIGSNDPRCKYFGKLEQVNRYERIAEDIKRHQECLKAETT